MGLPDRPPTSISKQNPSNGIIRWRKGELIGAGAFGRVYMGMNLDSGELLAVKQVLIAPTNAAKQKAQAHLKGLEEEVKLLQKLSHPNIVRYVGTAREDDALNIFLEFVPGGSISSLISKFGAFPEPVIRNYTRQLLTGLEYLHKNGIMHRDIKGANILVDNKGSIKVADFGASKQVVELVTTTVAKSVKGTAYWMAPEVIRQTGHNLKADIWSVGCTVIEMATGRPPWSQQFQEVAALFHIGTTNSHPPIPEHLSSEAQDFLLKCLKQEPDLRPTSTELLKHPFISGDGFHSPLSPEVVRVSKDSQILDNCKRRHLSTESQIPNVEESVDLFNKPVVVNHDYDKFSDAEQIQRSSVGTDFNCSVRLDFDSFAKSFKSCSENPFWSQPFSFNNDADDGMCNFASPEIQRNKDVEYTRSPTPEFYQEKSGFSFKCSPTGEVNDDDDDEVTESKIKAFLDEKAEELKKLQTPLYMEFHSICNFQQTPEKQYPSTDRVCDGLPLPPSSIKSTSKSSSTISAITTSRSCDSGSLVISKNSVNGLSQSTNFSCHLESPRVQVLRGILKETQQPLCSPSNFSLSERQRLWKEELQQELAMKREEMRKLSRVAPSPRLSRSSSMHSLKRKQP